MTPDATMRQRPCCAAAPPLCAVAGIIAGLLLGCIVGGEQDRCGENQILLPPIMCTCADGYMVGADRTTCEKVPEPVAGLGDACTSTEDCTTPYDFCADDDGGEYCTTAGCTSSADCEVGWYCETSSAGSYCHEPPTGLGASCQDDNDCEGLQATFCESFVTHECLVIGCSADAPCPNGYVCCDLTATGFFDGTQCHAGSACMIGEMVE